MFFCVLTQFPIVVIQKKVNNVSQAKAMIFQLMKKDKVIVTRDQLS